MSAEPHPPATTASRVVALHTDASLLVIDKPAGLLCVPGRGEDKQDCLSARVRAVWPDALVVHRLDQATSGLVLFACGIDAQRRLGAAFERRAVHKRYVAVVAGCMAAGHGQIDAPLSPDWPRRPLQRIDWQAGKPARSDWRVLQHDQDAGTTRVELTPLTGRTHQLRLHLQHIGHPILGDALYAPADVQARATRLLLHASALRFTHPGSGDTVAFLSAAPF